MVVDASRSFACTVMLSVLGNLSDHALVLSFVYPLAIAGIKWIPPLTERRNFFLLSGYTFVAAFLMGFFSLGTPLATAWAIGGVKILLPLISGAWIHGPLEFAFVLLDAT